MPFRPALAALAIAVASHASAAPPLPNKAPPRNANAIPAPAAAAPSRLVPVLHVSVGTGACATAHSDATRIDNPCWLQLGVAPAVRYGAWELGLAYEGREVLKLLTLALVQPPAATTLGASL
ncbi:MAG: hypothetical protein NDI82_12310, partial [Anaeromyxobacteraceae bacterium]|nr:hypothetical protein [Anaeromyxobacteraceae bacterium]